jgi:hypothetical protein
VQLYHVPAASPLVQPIHVLRHEGEARDPTLELCERQVSRGRIGLRHEFAPPLVALLHQAWIPVGSLSGREPLKIVALLEPCLGLAEGWHPALSRDPRARKRDHALGVAEGSDQVLWDILRADATPFSERFRPFSCSTWRVSLKTPRASRLPSAATSTWGVGRVRLTACELESSRPFLCRLANRLRVAAPAVRPLRGPYKRA